MLAEGETDSRPVMSAWAQATRKDRRCVLGWLCAVAGLAQR